MNLWCNICGEPLAVWEKNFHKPCIRELLDGDEAILTNYYVAGAPLPWTQEARQLSLAG